MYVIIIRIKSLKHEQLIKHLKREEMYFSIFTIKYIKYIENQMD